VNLPRSFVLFPGLLLGLSLVGSSARADDLPSRPEFGIRDDALVLPLPILKLTEHLIAEHESLTQERISILTLRHSPKDLKESTAGIFEEWRKTAPKPPDSVLIVVDAEKGQIEIRTGLGLDPVLTSAKIEDIRKRIFTPEWSGDKPYRALVLTFVETLRSLGSPLIEREEAISAYEHAGFSGGWTPVEAKGKSRRAWFFALVGIFVAGFALVRIMIGEVHYTEAGWYPVPASHNLRRILRRRGGRKTPSLVTGGGVSGKY
jgi:uncharacterized membrane protein YgcG